MTVAGDRSSSGSKSRRQSPATHSSGGASARMMPLVGSSARVCSTGSSSSARPRNHQRAPPVSTITSTAARMKGTALSRSAGTSPAASRRLLRVVPRSAPDLPTPDLPVPVVRASAAPVAASASPSSGVGASEASGSSARLSEPSPRSSLSSSGGRVASVPTSSGLSVLAPSVVGSAVPCSGCCFSASSRRSSPPDCVIVVLFLPRLPLVLLSHGSRITGRRLRGLSWIVPEFQVRFARVPEGSVRAPETFSGEPRGVVERGMRMLIALLARNTRQYSSSRDEPCPASRGPRDDRGGLAHGARPSKGESN